MLRDGYRSDQPQKHTPRTKIPLADPETRTDSRSVVKRSLDGLAGRVVRRAKTATITDTAANSAMFLTNPGKRYR